MHTVVVMYTAKGNDGNQSHESFCFLLSTFSMFSESKAYHFLYGGKSNKNGKSVLYMFW